ncbi:MarR family winged helix-turn-helix transcriptional regulator [Qipengyuania gaetbuli]|uniref:HTH marR-type domain-containing protein n=1 Tax=Qipengyuania gaetbuli TaxID=266952 RepID=A0A844Y3B8_9SPHN|nr:MarR family winged helix-turn-helix transcriptional regulator [Qipengyuania gaetbuli]MBY6015788.1 MarR family winged helix-turn-helix transcriptional regulator [Qipengyuania gaetbuli]MXO51588.1 hypothetical protein [Qipengyuania gaetbuli]
MKKILSQFAAAFGQAGIQVFTVEGRIIIHLISNGESRIKELLLASGSSYRGFYLALERLKAKGIVTSELDPHDRRARRIKLTQHDATRKLDELA